MIRTTIRSAHSTFMSSNVRTDSGSLTRGYLEMIRSMGKLCDLFFGEGGKQIDFIALSMFQSVDDVKIARDLTFSSDHLPLTITYESQWSLANHHRQQNHRVRKHVSLSSEIGSQMTIGTTQFVFLRYPGRTGRRFPDTSKLTLSWNHLSMHQLESSSESKETTDTARFGGCLSEQTLPTISTSQHAFQLVEYIWPKR